MTEIMETLLFMLAVLAAVAVAAQRLNVAPSILLVVAGIGMALIPGLPRIELAPELVLLVILPPLIYSAGVAAPAESVARTTRSITHLAGCLHPCVRRCTRRRLARGGACHSAGHGKRRAVSPPRSHSLHHLRRHHHHAGRPRTAVAEHRPLAR